jgi:hypothetical protein
MLKALKKRIMNKKEIEIDRRKHHECCPYNEMQLVSGWQARCRLRCNSQFITSLDRPLDLNELKLWGIFVHSSSPGFQMAHMLAAATSFFARTNISQSYNIGNSAPPGLGTRPSTPSGSTSTSLSAPPAPTPTFYIGLWKVQSAWHKTTSKRVSVWTFDKRGPDMERLGAQGKDRVIEVMKAEVSYLKNL